ncbi:hypothetical protein CDL12_19313 [Handroanthus impetiginosus]|uniref:Uncharacterized protein n=1 Tax=Handroanthus impetiginosus TaxID=429701 RepID=A0A2G9GSX4_9LAMI|nr:hypothetical protein CDL12_19313 [Handroanthus impetiginosus]
MALDDAMIETLTSKIDHKLGALSTNTSYPSCIYRVPDKPRKANEAACTPRLVSIGPLHRQRGQLQGMESYKLRCLRNFLTRITVKLCDLVRSVAKCESIVRGCYEDKINLNQEQFLEVILLDGIFIVEVFLKNFFPRLREESDIIFKNRWMWSDLLHDMLLLENQLPIYVIDNLFNFVDHSFLNRITLHDLAHEFFKDFLLFLHNPPVPLNRKRSSLLFPAMNFQYTRSATELKQAGVKFCHVEDGDFFDVVFINGELRLPILIVNDLTETFFGNIIAFEQCGYCWRDITSYVILMDSLINTPEDVDLLVNHGIIKNELGESEAEVVTETDEFYFAKVCGNLNKYSRDPFHEFKAKWFRWRRMLRRNYFGNPWSFISLLAAFVLLILTVIQTVCSILQVK